MIEFEHAVPSVRAQNPVTRGHGTFGTSRARHGLHRAVTWLEAQALFVAGSALVAAFSLAHVPQDLNQDGWLALVGGRYVAAHGIPQHDTLTVMAHGTRWVDQQWLSQLAMYGLHQVGGLQLYSIAYVALTMAGLGLTIAAARALGGSERHVTWMLAPAGFLYFAGSFQIRTQGFAYPLFAATLWLLAKEVRSKSRRRVYLVLPLLIVWANLHGSVTVGATVAVIYGLTLLIEDLTGGGWRGAHRRIRRRTVVFLIAPVLCLFATPYGFSMVTYYRATLLNPAFGHLVTEWQPVTSIMALAVPFFALVFGALWLLGRAGRRAEAFDQLTLVVLAFGAVLAVRNITWFGLAVLALLPSTIGTLLPSRGVPTRRRTVNLSLSAGSLAILAGSLIAVASQPDSWFQSGYDRQAVGVVAAVVKRQPHTLIYAGDRWGDWLLWQDPNLAGHIAYDIRFELLSARQLQEIADVGQIRSSQDPDILAPYGLLVLNSTGSADSQPLLDRRRTHLLLRGKGVIVATTPAL